MIRVESILTPDISTYTASIYTTYDHRQIIFSSFMSQQTYPAVGIKYSSQWALQVFLVLSATEI